MTAMPAVAPMTAEEFLALPYQERNRFRELIGGELVVDEPLLPHQLVRKEISFALELWTRAADGRGLVTQPIDVRIGRHDVYGPDVLWYRDGRVPDRDAGRPYPLPDLAVEVRSPGTWRFDIGTKKSAYERAGLPELWLVDTPADEILVYRRSGPRAATFDVALELERTDTLTSPLLPGLALALGAVFG